MLGASYQNFQNYYAGSIDYIKEFKENSNLIHNAYDNLSTLFYGFTLEGKYEDYENQNFKKNDSQDYNLNNYIDYKMSAKLNFSLFKGGFFEYKKDVEIARKRWKIAYLKDLSILSKNRFASQKVSSRNLSHEIEYLYYVELVKLYGKSMKLYDKKYHNSMIEKYNYDLIKQTYQRYQKYLNIYRGDTRNKISANKYKILKYIDYFKLKSLSNIIQYAKTNNNDKALNSAKSKLLKVNRSYFDDVKIDIYAKKNYTDEIGGTDVLGIDIALPLNSSSSEEARLEIMKLRSNQIVSNSIQESIVKQIKILHTHFLDIKKFIKVDREDMLYFKIRIKEFKKLKRNMIDNISVNPDKEILNANRKIIDLKFGILKRKIELINTLYEIAYISNITNIMMLERGQ